MPTDKNTSKPTVKITVMVTPAQFKRAKAAAKNAGFVMEDKTGDVTKWLLNFLKERGC